METKETCLQYQYAMLEAGKALQTSKMRSEDKILEARIHLIADQETVMLCITYIAILRLFTEDPWMCITYIASWDPSQKKIPRFHHGNWTVGIRRHGDETGGVSCICRSRYVAYSIHTYLGKHSVAAFSLGWRDMSDRRPPQAPAFLQGSRYLVDPSWCSSHRYSYQMWS